MNQTTIFDMMYPKYKIAKPIRLIELFAGYGSQALALKYLGVKFEHWKICEWAVKSIQAYKDIHFTNDTKEISMSKDEMIDYLYNKGISSNYNEPMTKSQISRLNEKQLKTIIENIEITHNLVNIQQVKGQDLEIIEKEQYEYILTYSFPCQDLSLAGKGKGMADTSTRSGMLWEVERILNELKETNSLPQILLMENVPQVHGSDNVEHFNKWQLALERFGYKSYFQGLIATDYGIPQTRNRCFMVSILGEYSYTFPKPIPLKLKLKDMLEDEVDEKYYLSDRQIKDIQNWNAYEKPLENMEKIDKTDIRPTLTTRSGAYAAGMILVKNATKKGYLEATDGDGIDISSRMEHHRGTVQKNKIQTLTTSGGNDRGVVINPLKDKTSYGWHFEQNVYDKNSCCRTLKASEGSGNKPKVITNALRIRKLTPREAGRLMCVKDEDIDKILKNQSNSSAFHLFGDSICTSCLMALFSQLLDISWEDKLWNIKNSTKTENI